MSRICKYFLVILFLSVLNISARPWRPGQIPNGSKFSCATCHVDPNGGGARNAFGQEVERRVTPGGQEEFWSAALAFLDSDGDGKSNGSELQDPNGVWRPGSPAPGNFSLVTNPGNALSVGITNNYSGLPQEFRLLNNYPNPFNPATEISYSLPRSSQVSIYVYNVLGQMVAILANNELKQAGNYKVTFNGDKLPSGQYLYRLITPEFIDTKKMILLK